MWRAATFAALAALALAVPVPARADLLAPADEAGIRRFQGGSPFLLDFLSVRQTAADGSGDRTVLAFDLSGLAGGAASATLDLGLLDLDPGLPGVIDVSYFFGSGTVSPELFDAPATLLTSFPLDASGSVQVDVTAAVLAAQDAGAQFLDFRLSTTTDSRYLLEPPFTAARPALEVTPVPAPGGLALLGLGGLALAAYDRLRRRRAG